ncbi:MAG: thioredoxin-disulfide reductase [Planctomycetes bacterium]|nr:thioredoxin-disulfide reductase [Planctomycetota bacterium]
MSDVKKILIIGSGPAGMTAAIYASRAELQPVLIEGLTAGGSPGGQLTITTEVENFPGFPQGVDGKELVALFKKQAKRFSTEMIEFADVHKVDFSTRPFTVWTDMKEFKAESVIIATGARARWLDVEGESTLQNRGVSACATCDGAMPIFRNQELIVVGGGDTAAEEALFLTKFASKVYVVHRRDELRASKIMRQRLTGHEKVVMVWDSVLDEIYGEKRVEGVKIKNVKTGEITDKKVAGVFMAIGHTPNTEIFKGQIALDDVGYIQVKPGLTYTNVDGVFACGDVMDSRYRQAITAAGTGCMAAIDAERWLAEQGIE